MALYRALLPLFIYVCRSALGQSVVEVEVGAPSVTLPGTARPLVNVPSVLWTRGSEEVHVRVLKNDDLRNQNPLFTNRTQMNPDALERGNVSLELKNPTLTDSGTYRCVVREVIKEVDRFTVELRVKGLKVDVTEGSSISLPFSLMRTLESEVSVKWTFGSQEVHLRRGGADDFSAQSGQFKGRTQMKPDALQSGDLSLELKDLTLRDSGHYTCVVTEGSTELARTTVHLYVEPFLLPWNIIITILLLLFVPVVLLLVVLILLHKRQMETHDSFPDPVIISIFITVFVLLPIIFVLIVVVCLTDKRQMETHDPVIILIISIVILLLLPVLLLVVLFLTDKRKKQTHESWTEAFIRMITCRPHPSTPEIIEKLSDKIEKLSAREEELSDKEEERPLSS